MINRLASPVAAGGLCLLTACGGSSARQEHRAHIALPQAQPKPQPDSQPQRGSVSGRFTDRETNLPLAGVDVTVQEALRPVVVARAVTRPDGTWTLPDLPLGKPLRVVCQPGVGAITYALEAGGPVTLTPDNRAASVDLAFRALPQGGTGSVEGAPCRRPGRLGAVTLIQQGPGGAVTLVRTAAILEDGSFRMVAVPPGDYRVRYQISLGDRREPGPFFREVKATVKAGEATRVELPSLRHGHPGRPLRPHPHARPRQGHHHPHAPWALGSAGVPA